MKKLQITIELDAEETARLLKAFNGLVQGILTPPIEPEVVDDISEEVKTARLTEIINLQTQLSAQSNKRELNREVEVLVEGESKRSKEQMFGRTSQNKVVVFDRHDIKVGDYVTVKITACSSATLMGDVVGK